MPDIICLLFERRHLLPTLKNALLFACAQMGGFGLGEQVVRVKVILFIGLSPPGNTNVHTVEATNVLTVSPLRPVAALKDVMLDPLFCFVALVL